MPRSWRYWKVPVNRPRFRRRPELVVTPTPISPCIVGTWKPRIIVPESIVTESTHSQLRHVLAHEMAHLCAGICGRTGCFLSARTLHWFNPLAWWVVREMRAEREAACDDLALAALGETERSAYAATIIDLAASLAPSGMAPAMIGLISSTRRLTARIERLGGPSAVVSLRPTFVAGILLVVALVGLTDAMPDASLKQAEAKSAPAAAKSEVADAKTVTLRGRCVDQVDGSASRRSPRADIQGPGKDCADCRGRERPQRPGKGVLSFLVSPRRARMI